MNISFETAFLEKEILYFPAWDYDKVCTYSLCDNRLQFLENYKGLNIFDGPKYGAICTDGKLIYLAPIFSKNIDVIDFFGNNQKTIELKIKGNVENLFLNSYVGKKFIYFFPGNYNRIIKIDKETMLLSDIDISSVANDMTFRHGCVCIGDCLYLSLFNTSKLFRLDLKTDRYDVIDIGYTCASVCKGRGENELLVLKDDGGVAVYNVLSGEKSIIFENEHMDVEGKVGYSEIVYSQKYKKIVCLPLHARRILVIDINTGKLLSSWGEYAVFWASIVDDNIVYFFSNDKKELKCLNMSDNSIENVYKLSDRDVFEDTKKIMYTHYNNKKSIINEMDDDSLLDFVNYCIGDN